MAKPKNPAAWRGMQTYLQLGEMFRPLVDIHASKTDADGTGRHDDDTVARLLQLDGSVHNKGQDGQERLVCLFIHNRACAWERRDVSARNTKWNSVRAGFFLHEEHVPSLMTTVKGLGFFMVAGVVEARGVSSQYDAMS